MAALPFWIEDVPDTVFVREHENAAYSLYICDTFALNTSLGM
jgi:hypothetical protein